MPEVSNSPRLLLKNPSPFFSTPPLFFILLQITRVGPLLIVLCVTSHQDKRRRGRGKSHMKILKQATGMSTDWWESLFLIHISLFTVGSSSLAIYGILSDHSWFQLSLSWRVGPYGSCCTSVGWKLKKNPKESVQKRAELLGWAHLVPTWKPSPGGKAAEREKLRAVVLDRLLSQMC